MTSNDEIYELRIPNARRPKRRIFASEHEAATIVIDNGSSELRAGFAGEPDPCLRFPNQLIRPKSRASTEIETVVGDSPFSIKGYDLGRVALRSAFDGNVVVNFDTEEAILDYVFDRLGFQSALNSNPIVMTECLLNPSHSRDLMLELMFECYDVPSVVFVPDCLAAFAFNRSAKRCSSDSVIVCSGHAATHVVPIIDNEAHLTYAQRLKIGGAQATLHLQQLMMLHNPQCVASTNKSIVEWIKEQCTFCSEDYLKAVNATESDDETVGGLGIKIQLPKSSNGNGKEEIVSEPSMDRATRDEEQRQRLKAMSQRRREKMMNDKEELLSYLKDIHQQIMLSNTEENVQGLLEEAEVTSVTDLVRTIEGTQASLERMRRSEMQPAESKSRSKQDQSDENKEEMLELLRARYQELTDRQEQQKRGSLGLDRLSGPSSKRISTEQRRRMQLVVAAAAKEENDNFGADDRDWDVYKEMDTFQDAERQRQEEIELRVTKEKLQQLGESFEEPSMDFIHDPKRCYLEENQAYLSLERIRVSELLFQPSLAGNDQAGIHEIVTRVVESVPKALKGVYDPEIFLCGGNAAFKGLPGRLETEVRSMRPLGRPLRVVSSQNWFLDAWRGASQFSRTSTAAELAYSLSEYKERGIAGMQKKRIPFVYYTQ